MEEWLEIKSFPRDPWRYYTTRRILEIIGLAKSTYYELLRNEDYGNGTERRAMRDDEDILFVQKVAEYKGYRKGYRQISMMMEDSSGSTAVVLCSIKCRYLSKNLSLTFEPV